MMESKADIFCWTWKNRPATKLAGYVKMMWTEILVAIILNIVPINYLFCSCHFHDNAVSSRDEPQVKSLIRCTLTSWKSKEVFYCLNLYSTTASKDLPEPYLNSY